MSGIHSFDGSWHILSSRFLRFAPINNVITTRKYNSFIATLAELVINVKTLFLLT